MDAHKHQRTRRASTTFASNKGRATWPWTTSDPPDAAGDEATTVSRAPGPIRSRGAGGAGGEAGDHRCAASKVVGPGFTEAVGVEGGFRGGGRPDSNFVAVRAVGQCALHVKPNSHGWRSKPCEGGAFAPSTWASVVRGTSAMSACSHAGRPVPCHRRKGVRMPLRPGRRSWPADPVAPARRGTISGFALGRALR